jgi:biopolymer transport protein ExbD
MIRRWRKKHLANAPELNITAFMNLMVILVPFLLITAVFSRITILELNVPEASSSSQVQNDEPALELEVIVSNNSIDVSDRRRGLLKSVRATGDGSDLEAVSDLLQQIKARFPDKSDVTLLVDTEVAYERLVAVMDTLRIAQVEQNGERVQTELFPLISIGDAPTGGSRNIDRKP